MEKLTFVLYIVIQIILIVNRNRNGRRTIPTAIRMTVTGLDKPVHAEV